MAEKHRGQQIFADRVEVGPSGQLAAPCFSARCINKTGGTLAAGACVIPNGKDTTSGLTKVILADASVAGTLPGVGILPIAIADNTAGDITMMGPVATTLNTAAAAVGDPVYVSDTAGDLGLAAGTVASIIGMVHTVAAAGEVFVWPGQVA